MSGSETIDDFLTFFNDVSFTMSSFLNFEELIFHVMKTVLSADKKLGSIEVMYTYNLQVNIINQFFF
jgi:hypothetical protein